MTHKVLASPPVCLKWSWRTAEVLWDADIDMHAIPNLGCSYPANAGPVHTRLRDVTSATAQAVRIGVLFRRIEGSADHIPAAWLELGRATTVGQARRALAVLAN